MEMPRHDVYEKESFAYTPISKHRFWYIDKVGVELEGGWKNGIPYEVHHDGSVNVKHDKVGEVHTEPKSKLEDVFAEVKAKYPHGTNDSCGMHVHVSLPPGQYAILMSPEFWNYFKFRMERLAKYLSAKDSEFDSKTFIERFGGSNTYCKNVFAPSKQAFDKGKGSNRYAMLNYCHTLHGTLECRLFPMFAKKSNAYLAIYEFCDTIETFLRNNKEQVTFWSSVDADYEENSAIKEEIICV